jgi:hypothetical protein
MYILTLINFFIYLPSLIFKKGGLSNLELIIKLNKMWSRNYFTSYLVKLINHLNLIIYLILVNL